MADVQQREKLAAAKKKLRRFQQKAARLERKASENGSTHDSEILSQASDQGLHQQTIDILVEEKTELMKARDKQNSAIQQHQDEISVLKSQLHSTNAELTSTTRKLTQLEKLYLAAQNDTHQKTEEVRGLMEQNGSFSTEVASLKNELSTITNERNELITRLAGAASSAAVPINDMSNVPNPFRAPTENAINLQKDVDRLRNELEAIKQSVLSKDAQVDTLSGELSLQKLKHSQQINDYEDTVSSHEALIQQLRHEIIALQQKKAAEPNVEDAAPSVPQNIVVISPEMSQKLDKLKEEKMALEHQKIKLQQSLEEQVMQTLTLQSQLDKYKETHVDSSTLLTQINNDKATISRAMGQNKQLKEQLVELQDKLMKTSETNATLANEVQELSASLSQAKTQLSEEVSKRQGSSDSAVVSEDSILGESKHVIISELRDQVVNLTDQISSLQQEKAILGLSAAQVDSVKAQNIELQERINGLNNQVKTGKSPREVQLEQKLLEIERQYNTAMVEERIQKIQLTEREEREKQRLFLDKYYEEQLREQIGILEKRIATQTKQFQQYISDLQISHDDEVEALRLQLSNLQENYRSSLQTQYNQLVQYFTAKEASDMKAREEELHGHYMEEITRLYSEMTSQAKKETEELRQRHRTQSDNVSVYTVEEDDREWEAEKKALQDTLDNLEKEIINVECGTESEDEEELEKVSVPEAGQSSGERKLQARVRLLELQLAREREHKVEEVSKYRSEVQRQSNIIQRLHAYLSSQENEGPHCTPNNIQVSASPAIVDAEEEDNLSLTSAGQFTQQLTVDRSVTRDSGTRDGVSREGNGNCDAGEKDEGTILHSYTSQEMEFDTKIKYLLSKVPEGGQYVQHMQKLQEKFAKIMKDNASLQEKLRDVEHQNMLLEGETDTIGEYISLYQNQRRALRLQFQNKDNFIEKLLSERNDMQTHILRLQQLIMELPCVEEEEDVEKNSTIDKTLTRDRSNSISSTLSTASILSTTKTEMLDLIEKLKLHKRDKVIGGPIYAGSRGPIKDI